MQLDFISSEERLRMPMEEKTKAKIWYTIGIWVVFILCMIV